MAAPAGERLQLHHHGVVLDYLFRPGAWMSDEELLQLRQQLSAVNQLARRPLSYGLFDPKRSSVQDLREFFLQANACRMLEGGKVIGYLYTVELQHPSLRAVHGGLVVVGKNPGIDLVVFPMRMMTVLLFRKRGPFYFTSITAIPAVVGGFAESLSSTWPSHKASCARPPSREYVGVLELLEMQYIRKYFPAEGLSVDRKRFVLTSGSMGFESDLRKLSRHPDLLANLFCQFWLDVSKGEDLIQVGRMNLRAAMRMSWPFLKYWLQGKARLRSSNFVEPAAPNVTSLPDPAPVPQERRGGSNASTRGE